MLLASTLTALKRATVPHTNLRGRCDVLDTGICIDILVNACIYTYLLRVCVDIYTYIIPSPNINLSTDPNIKYSPVV